MARRKTVAVIESAETQGDSDQIVAAARAENDEEATADTAPSDSVESALRGSGFSVVDHRADDAEPLSSIEVVEAQPRRGRPPGTGKTRVPRATPNEIAQAAPLLVGLTNQVVVTWMGPECAMLQTEANFLTPSVARILSRLPRGAAQQVSVYTDPFIVLVALGLWAARITRVKDQQARNKYYVEPHEQARAVGESGTELTPDTPAEQPMGEPSEESKNGRARAVSNAILRTVSPT